MDDMQWWRSSRCGGGACVEVAAGPDGQVLMRDSKDPDGPTLAFTTAEWEAFVAGIRAGEFDAR